MSSPGTYADTWRRLLEVISAAVKLRGDGPAPLILSSLPHLPTDIAADQPFSFIQGPPGRNIAIAMGLRAALPDVPILLIMNSDAITLGTNHLNHAARRNVQMTLLLLRSDLTATAENESLDRLGWGSLGFQESIEGASTPLEWAKALEAALVARGNINDSEGLAALINEALDTPGFSLIGVTSASGLEMGVLSRVEWPEFFHAYRKWAKSFAELSAEGAKPDNPSINGSGKAASDRIVRRREYRIAGIGGQGVKLAGTVLSQAAGLYEGLWATHRGEYGSATRGGPSMVDVVVSSDRITYPGADRPDVLIVMSQSASDLHAAKLNPAGYLVADSDQVTQLPPGAIPVPIVRLAREHAGKPIAAGVVALGCVAAASEVISLESMRQSVAAKVPLRTVEKNVAAMEAGYNETRAAMKQRVA